LKWFIDWERIQCAQTENNWVCTNSELNDSQYQCA
jgi:hypothetical protein